MKIAGRDGQKKQMAERILHEDGNGNFTIGSRGSTHKKNHVGRRADMVFLMGAMEGVQGKPAANAAGVLWQAERSHPAQRGASAAAGGAYLSACSQRGICIKIQWGN